MYSPEYTLLGFPSLTLLAQRTNFINSFWPQLYQCLSMISHKNDVLPLVGYGVRGSATIESAFCFAMVCDLTC